MRRIDYNRPWRIPQVDTFVERRRTPGVACLFLIPGVGRRGPARRSGGPAATAPHQADPGLVPSFSPPKSQFCASY